MPLGRIATFLLYCPFFFLILAWYLDATQVETGLVLLLNEDGFLEYLSFAIWFLLSIVFLQMAYDFYQSRPNKWLIPASLYALSSFVSAVVLMEEVSWFQRILGFATPENLEQINYQKEFNFHNIQMGEVKVNRLLLQVIAPIIMLSYFLIIPLLVRLRIQWVKCLVGFFKLALFPLKHLPAFLIYLVIAYEVIDYERRGELVEFYVPFIWLVLFSSQVLQNLVDKKVKARLGKHLK